jgi:hydrogenase maturation factor
MLADLSYYENISNDVAYEEIGKHVINNIDIISGKYINYSPSGIIDENDMRVIISEPGYLSAYILDKVSADMIEHEGIQAQLINLIKKSPACDINRDKKVSQLGVIVNAPEEIVETTKTGNYDELNDYVGIPYGVFENYSISNTTMGQFIILYSGMNMSQARIEKAKAKIQEKQKQEEAIAKKAGVDFGVDTNNLSIFKDSHRMNILVSATPDDDEEKKGSVLDSFFD